MNKNNILKSTFEVIRNEELKTLKEEIGQSMANAYTNMGTLLSSDFSSNLKQISHNHINKIFNKVINKLKSEQPNKHIIKDSVTFINEIDECIKEVVETISAMIGKNRISEQDLEKLIEQNNNNWGILKKDLIKQWNLEAEIINTNKPNFMQRLLENKIFIGVISFIGGILGTIAAAIILNKYGLK